MNLRFIAKGTKTNGRLPESVLVVQVKAGDQEIIWIENKLQLAKEFDNLEWTASFDTIFKKDRITLLGGGWTEWTNHLPD